MIFQICLCIEMAMVRSLALENVSASLSLSKINVFNALFRCITSISLYTTKHSLMPHTTVFGSFTSHCDNLPSCCTLISSATSCMQVHVHPHSVGMISDTHHIATTCILLYARLLNNLTTSLGLIKDYPPAFLMSVKNLWGYCPYLKYLIFPLLCGSITYEKSTYTCTQY